MPIPKGKSGLPLPSFVLLSQLQTPVRRYAPLNPVGVHNGQGAVYPLNLLLGSFFRLSSETRQTLGSAMIVTCMSFCEWNTYGSHFLS